MFDQEKFVKSKFRKTISDFLWIIPGFFFCNVMIVIRLLFHEILFFCFSAFALEDITAKTRHGAAIIHMILNNLDPRVAQFPQELVTYGGNGQVFSNWAQVLYPIYYLDIIFYFKRLTFSSLRTLLFTCSQC